MVSGNADFIKHFYRARGTGQARRTFFYAYCWKGPADDYGIIIVAFIVGQGVGTEGLENL